MSMATYVSKSYLSLNRLTESFPVQFSMHVLDVLFHENAYPFLSHMCASHKGINHATYQLSQPLLHAIPKVNKFDNYNIKRINNVDNNLYFRDVNILSSASLMNVW